MSNKSLEVIMTICAAISIAAAICLFVIALYPFQVFDVKTPLTVISKKVNQGDCVFVEMEYNKKIPGPSVVTVQVVTKEGTHIASQILGMNLDEGKHKIQIGFMLPRNINLASNKPYITAKLNLISRFEVYGFRRIDVSYCTEEFRIIL